MSKADLRRERNLHIRNTLVMWACILLFISLVLSGPVTPLKLPWLAVFLFILYHMRMTYVSVHPQLLFMLRSPKPDEANLVVEEVTFPSRDGLLIGGWYIRGKRRSAIIMAHGLGGSRSSLVFHAAPLAVNGYGLLLIDLRAHGKSQGEVSTFGIREANDVLGGLDYLHTRPEVDPEQIGALGISLGAQAILRASVRDRGLKALVLEGLSQMSLEDHPEEPRTLLRRLYMPLNGFLYTLANWMAGIPEPESTTMALRRLKRPVLLISTGKGLEHAFNRLFKDKGGSQVSLWELPSAPHAAAYFADRKGYMERIVRFFNQTFEPGSEVGRSGQERPDLVFQVPPSGSS